jgi:hypothetical protein
VRVEAEIAALKSAPGPAPDLRDRIRAYVDGLAYAGRPSVRSIGASEPRSTGRGRADSRRRLRAAVAG